MKVYNYLLIDWRKVKKERRNSKEISKKAQRLLRESIMKVNQWVRKIIGNCSKSKKKLMKVLWLLKKWDYKLQGKVLRV